MMTESWDYDSILEAVPDEYTPNHFDADRLNSAGWRQLRYLLKPLDYGDVSVTCRGKEIIIAAGFVRVTCYPIALGYSLLCPARCQNSPRS